MPLPAIGTNDFSTENRTADAFTSNLEIYDNTHKFLEGFIVMYRQSLCPPRIEKKASNMYALKTHIEIFYSYKLLFLVAENFLELQQNWA